MPQGSILGPLLFLIYIDDISHCVLYVDSSLNLYADDMLLYKLIKSHNYIVQLQADVDQIADWVDGNLLTLNGDKCKVMLISRRRNTQQLQLCLKGSPLEQVQSFKYLGVLIASDLSWSSHISMCCTKAKKLLGMLYRKFYNHIDYDSFLKIYLALVRPHLEYAATPTPAKTFSAWRTYRSSLYECAPRTGDGLMITYWIWPPFHRSETVAPF